MTNQERLTKRYIFYFKATSREPGGREIEGNGIYCMEALTEETINQAKESFCLSATEEVEYNYNYEAHNCVVAMIVELNETNLTI